MEKSRCEGLVAGIGWNMRKRDGMVLGCLDAWMLRFWLRLLTWGRNLQLTARRGTQIAKLPIARLARYRALTTPHRRAAGCGHSSPVKARQGPSRHGATQSISMMSGISLLS
jgi:hypothetical protein